MQYRTFGKLEWRPSALGFGAMRLPVIDGDRANIDVAEATRMLRYAIDHGVNYVDTAYPYHARHSETLVGRALQDGYRQRVKLATKLTHRMLKEFEDLDAYLEAQLARLQTDHIDFYLLHGLDEKGWQECRAIDALKWAEQAMADGRIGHLGFSFHDRFEVFQDIVDAYDGWTFCQIQYNYMDEEHQAGTRGLKYAAEKGLAIVVMEPLRGGQLAGTPPPEVQALWDRAPRQRTPAEWALQWVWDHPEVSLLLSGMSTMEQVQQNIASACDSGPGTLSDEEKALIAQVRDTTRKLCPIPCTGCEYCLPCPNDVNIPRILQLYNEAFMYNDVELARANYGWVKAEQRADQCIACGECEEKCPQGISIIEWLEKADRLLSAKEG